MHRQRTLALAVLLATARTLAGCGAPEHGDATWTESQASALHKGAAQACRLAPRPSDAKAPPPRGWNTWNHFGCNIDEQVIRDTADAMVASGMQAAGYDYLVIDDCWATGRDARGAVIADPARFPSGIGALADYVHAKGLKFGIYTDAGWNTCAGRPGSFAHEQQDADTYAAWGVDYVKEDWCNTQLLTPAPRYRAMRDALAATGRDIVLGICDWGVDRPWVWGPETGTLWRTTQDIQASWTSVLSNFDGTAPLAAAARPGHWNDPDMLEVGQGLTDEESRAHFSLWAILSAPLIAGNDLRAMTPAVRDILTNREAIAVDEDPLGVQGTLVRELGAGLQIWAKPLDACGTRAVAVLNRGETTSTVTLDARDLALATGPVEVRDLWAARDLPAGSGAFTALVPPHGARLLRVQGSEQTPPPGDAYVSDLPWVYGASSWGPIERDRSNGEAQPGDGRTLSIRGTAHSKGLGTHADSAILLYLGGRCSRFSATVGIDDEVGAVTSATASFQVWGDGALLADSGPLTRSSAPHDLSADVRGVTSLWLVSNHAGDSMDFAHTDWADALIRCAP